MEEDKCISSASLVSICNRWVRKEGNQIFYEHTQKQTIPILAGQCKLKLMGKEEREGCRQEKKEKEEGKEEEKKTSSRCGMRWDGECCEGGKLRE